MPSTPTRARLAGKAIVMDSPLEDLSSNMTSLRLSPSKGAKPTMLFKQSHHHAHHHKPGAAHGSASSLGAEEKIPYSSTTPDVTSDWEARDGATVPGPKRRPASSSRGDRYIPNRELSRSTKSDCLLEHGGGDPLVEPRRSSSSCGSAADHSAHQASVAADNMVGTDVANASLGSLSLQSVLGIESSHRILSFSAAPPPPSSHSASSSAEVASRYAATRAKSTLPSSLVAGGKRVIPTMPIRTLDAPGLIDDYYCNLLSWSNANVLAVPLHSAVHLWNANNGDVALLVDVAEQPERVGGGSESVVTSCRFTHDGAYLAVATVGGYVQLWDVEAGTRMRTLKPSSQGGADNVTIGTMAWTPDGETFTLGYGSGLVRDHDVRMKESTIRNLASAHAGLAVCGLEWRGDGALLASGGNDNVVQVWDRRTSAPKMRKENHKAGVRALSWCPWNLSLLASGGGTMDRVIHLWNATSGVRTQSIQTHAQVTSLYFSHRYRELLSTHGASADSERASGSLAIWSHPSGNKVTQVDDAHAGRIVQTALSPDGQTLATCGSGDEDLKLWNVFEYNDAAAAANKPGQGGGGAGGAAGGAAATATGAAAAKGVGATAAAGGSSSISLTGGPGVLGRGAASRGLR